MPRARVVLRAVRSHLTYANVMATLAVFMVLGGGAYAATTLPARSVGTEQLRSDAVTRSRLADRSVDTKQLARDAVSLNRLSKGVRSRLAERAERGPAGPAGAQGPAGPAGSAGATGTRSFVTTAPNVTGYNSGDPLGNLSLPSNGLYIMFGSFTVQNNGPDAVGGGGCGFFNGARQLSAGSGLELDPGETETVSVAGLDEIRDSAQPLTLVCQYNTGAGPVDFSGISVRAVRLEE